jgi:hypothetical protein
MSLRSTARGFRAYAVLAAVTAVAITPAAASAAPATKAAKTAAKKRAAAKKQVAQLKEASGGKTTVPASAVKAVGQAQSTTPLAPARATAGLTTAMGLKPATQLAAMNTAIQGGPAFWTGLENHCANVTALLGNQPGMIMAGNFRDSEGNCYVWLNLNHSDLLTGEEICKTTLHEMGHLAGLQHSTNPLDVMYTPFQSDPIPSMCEAPAAAKVAAKAKASAAANVCPPGAANADYCQAAKPKTSKRRQAKRA